MKSYILQSLEKLFPKIFTKSTILFASGLAGVVYETIAIKQPNADLLVLFGGMMGLPAFFGNGGTPPWKVTKNDNKARED